MLKNEKNDNKSIDDWSEKGNNNSFNSFKTDGESNNLNELNNETTEKNEVIELPPTEIKSWDELDIDATLLRGIYSAGFEKPSPVQRKAIKPIIDGKDIIAQAQSGTGKTATFSIGALSKVDTSSNTVQILILAPTRELSKQHSEVIAQLGSAMSGLKILNLVGGGSVDDDAYQLKSNTPQIITGCPGRVYDMLRRNYISGKTIKLVILDEADELLSTGFKEQVYDIFQHFKTDIQVALFSATMPHGMNTITDKFMRNPVNIKVKAEQLTLEGIAQYFVAIEDDQQKYGTLKDLYKIISVSQCMIYCNSVKRVIDLYAAMVEDQFAVCCMHSEMTKQERDTSFTEFKNGKHRVMISSNVTARGIDIQQISIVINFDLPKDVHTYLHRIGRSGRWGRKGVGINMITRRDISKMKEIEQYYSTQIIEMPGDFENHLK
jgi:translation initiation factor 4A